MADLILTAKNSLSVDEAVELIDRQKQKQNRRLAIIKPIVRWLQNWATR